MFPSSCMFSLMINSLQVTSLLFYIFSLCQITWLPILLALCCDATHVFHEVVNTKTPQGQGELEMATVTVLFEW